MLNENFWNKEIPQFEIPKFECPYCHIGIIVSSRENITKKMIKSSSILFDITGDEKDYKGYFSSISECNNPDCLEKMIIVGETRLKYVGKNYAFEEDEFDYQHCKIVYLVDFTNPPIQLIKFPDRTPKELVGIFKESFKLFWIDENSCGNKIRSGVEKLLDLKKVKKYTINKKRKREALKLHSRIDKFARKNPYIAEKLLALKWIGNQASHSNSILTRKELIDAYKILEQSLIELFDKTRTEVNKLTSKINKAKKHKLK